ncbi:MAG: rRNA maturation RNase YbeY [Bacteroidota bacterium]
MSIHFFQERVSFTLPCHELFSRWLTRVVKGENRTIDHINYIFCSDNYLLKINQTHLQHDTFTDVITFNYGTAEAPLLADIYISIRRIRENSTKFKATFWKELARVMVHGILHVLGYKDRIAADKTKMRAKEDYALSLPEIKFLTSLSPISQPQNF